MTLEERLNELVQDLGRRFAEERDHLRETLASGLLAVREDRLDVRSGQLDIDERLVAVAKRFDRLSAELEERLASLKDGEQGPPGRDGEPGPEGAAGRDGITGEARGKYDVAESYQKFDRVSFNGSEWVACQDDPGPLPGKGWMLGAQGKRGRPGVGIQGASVKDYAVIFEMTDGKTIQLDLRGMFERYHEERDG